MAFTDWTTQSVPLQARMFLPAASARIDSEIQTGNNEVSPNTILRLPSNYADLFTTYTFERRLGGGASGAYVGLLRVKSTSHLNALSDKKPAFNRLKKYLAGGKNVFIKMYANAVDDHNGVGDERPFREVHTLVTMTGISGYPHVLDYGIVKSTAVSDMFGKKPDQHEPLEHMPKQMLFVVMTHPLLELQIDRVIPGDGNDLQHTFAPHMARKKATMLGVAIGIAAAYGRACRAIPGFRHNDLHPGNVIVDLTRTGGTLTNPRRQPWRLKDVVNLLGTADMQYLNWWNPLSKDLQTGLGAADGDIEWPRCGVIDFDLVGSSKWSWLVGYQRVKKRQTMSERLFQWVMHWIPISCALQWKNLLETLYIFQHGDHANDTRHILTYFMIGIVDFLQGEGVQVAEAYAIAHAAFSHFAQRKAVVDLKFATALCLSIFSLSLSFRNWILAGVANTIWRTGKRVSAIAGFFGDLNITFKHILEVESVGYGAVEAPVLTLAAKLRQNHTPGALEKQRTNLVQLAALFHKRLGYYPGTDELVGQFEVQLQKVKQLANNYVLGRILDVFGIEHHPLSTDASKIVIQVAFVNKKLKLSVKGDIKVKVGTEGWMKLKAIRLQQTEGNFQVAITMQTSKLFDWKRLPDNVGSITPEARARLNTTEGELRLRFSRHAEIFQLDDTDNLLDLLGYLLRPVSTASELPAWSLGTTTFLLRGPDEMYSVAGEDLLAEKSFLSTFVENWWGH